MLLSFPIKIYGFLDLGFWIFLVTLLSFVPPDGQPFEFHKKCEAFLKSSISQMEQFSNRTFLKWSNSQMEHFGVATLCHISRSQEQRNIACDVLVADRTKLDISRGLYGRVFCDGQFRDREIYSPWRIPFSHFCFEGEQK